MRWLLHISPFAHQLCLVAKCPWFHATLGNLGSVCDKCLWNSCSLAWKSLMCACGWLTIASCLWRLKFSAFKCFVMSTKNAKSANHTISNSSCIGCLLLVKNCAISSLRKKNHCSVALQTILHVTPFWHKKVENELGYYFNY